MPDYIADGSKEGEVQVSFKVSNKGEISDVELEEGFDETCDKEALRLVKSFPRFEPAKRRDTPIRSVEKRTIEFRNYKKARLIHKEKSYQKFLEENLIRPKEADDNKRGSKVVLSLAISKEGELTGTKVLESLSPACDQAALELTKKMTEWEPAKKNGEAIDSNRRFPVPFEGKQIPPEFPGGEKAMMLFLGTNISYPKDAQEAEIEGTVIVKFVINEKGAIQDKEIIGNVYHSLDAEAFRVIDMMPKWTPASVGGKAVSTFFTLPIHFRLKPKRQVANSNRAKTSTRTPSGGGLIKNY